MNKSKSILLFAASLILVIPIVIFIYPKVNPYAGLKKVTEKKAILEKSEELLETLGLYDENLKPSIEFEADKKLLRQSHMLNGVEQTNKLVADGMAGYRWKTRWKRVVDDDKSEDVVIRNRLENLIGGIRVDYDPSGNLMSFEVELDDKSKLKAINETQAKNITMKFLDHYCVYKNLLPDTMDSGANEISKELSISFTDEKGAEVENNEIYESKKTDYRFNFISHDDFSGNDVKINVSVKGNMISGFDVKQDIEQDFESNGLITKLSVLIIGILLMITLLVIAFKKFRAYEIGFKTAIFMGVVSAIGMLGEIVLETSQNFEWEIVIGWVLGPLFVGLGIIIIWAVSEATGREVWKRKYTEFDLILNGYYLNSNIGASVLTGFALGLLLISIWSLLTFLFDHLFMISVEAMTDSDSIYLSGGGPVYLLGQQLYRTIFKTAFTVGFVVSLLKTRFNSYSALLLIGSLVWVFTVQGNLEPFWVTIIVEFILALVIVYSFLRFNLLTVFVSILTFSTLYSGFAYFFIQDSDISGAIPLLIGLIALPIVYGFVSIFTKDKVLDLDTITPAFAKNITERQRLRGEIEAAKSIQESFLPSETPSMPGLDIAAKCLPALEVGGDYYDFVEHDSKKLSVIIGDVAGKGTKAAFVMTLTKGFFKALSRTLASPSKILSEINEMFYENVGRGSFITAIYGLFDLEARKFIYARAGHNPLLFIRKSEAQAKYLLPDGIALGMEKGILFSKTIKEEAIELQNGDLLVFYTDGFTEAMNTKDVQFGEDALQKLVEDNKDKSSREIMEIIFTDTLKFIGRAKQYDDMTMMIVKVV